MTEPSALTSTSTRLEFSTSPRTMPPKKTSHALVHDLVLDGYNSFLNNSKFDDLGNPFSETIVRVSQLPDWTLTKHKQLRISVKEGGNPLRHKRDGAPPLWDIIRRFLNNNLKELSVEALEAVPWQIAKHIWNDVLLTGQDSFRAWALFASVYGHEPGFECALGTSQQRNRKAHMNRVLPMDSIIAPISCPSFKWLVDLDLQASTGYTRFDFLELPNLPNLGALNISRHHQDLDIDDGIIRTWAMAAARQGKLTKLKVLAARNHLQVTARALEYLSWIGSLAVVDVTGCGVTGLKETRKLGWVTDSGLADTIEDPLKVWEIMRGETKNEIQKLVLQVRIEAPQPIPKRVGARTPTVFRRENNWANTKRKRNNTIPQPQAIPVLGMTLEDTVRKPKVLRGCKKKDIGSLLAEFGMSPTRES